MTVSRSFCASSSFAIGGTFLSFAYAGDVRALIAPLPAGGARRVSGGVRGDGTGEARGRRDKGWGRGRTFEVVDALSVEDAAADVYPRLAVPEEVDDVPDVLRGLGLLLHDELPVRASCG